VNFIGPELAKDIVRIWPAASFSEAERRLRRLAKIDKIEKDFMKNERRGDNYER